MGMAMRIAYASPHGGGCVEVITGIGCTRRWRAMRRGRSLKKILRRVQALSAVTR